MRTGVSEYLFGGGARFKSRYRLIECTAVAVYFFFLVRTFAKTWHLVAERPLLLLLTVPILLFALLTADFVSGLVHFLADTYCTEETPFLGPKLIAPFREHHRDPLAITRHDFVEANGDNCLVTLLVLVPYDLLSAGHSATSALVALYVGIFSFAILMTSVVHGWAHMDSPPPLARWLMKMRLSISREHHASHHRGTFQTHYCITTGWLNGPLDRVDFYGKLTSLLAAFGIRPAATAGANSSVAPQ